MKLYGDCAGIIHAFIDGHAIQRRLKDTESPWLDCPEPAFNFAEFEYRKTPKMREFWLVFYNSGRPAQVFDNQTEMQAWHYPLELKEVVRVTENKTA